MKKLKIFFTLIIFTLISYSWGKDKVVLTNEKGIYTLGYYFSFLRDEKGLLTLKDVNSPEILKKFKKVEKINPNFGITSAYYWARFEIENKAMEIPYWFVYFQLEFLDEVELYKKEGEKWEVIKTGDIKNFKTRERKHRSFVFKIHPRKKSLYYFRVRNSTSTQFPVKIFSPDAFEENEYKDNMIIGIYFGMMIVMILYNFFLFLSTRNISYFYYISYIIFWTFMSFTIFGLGQKYLFRNYPWVHNEGFGIQLSLVFLSLVMFTQEYLKLKTSAPGINKKLNILKVGLILLAFCTLFLDVQKVMFAIYACAGSMVILSLYSGFIRYKMKYRPATFYLFGFGLFFCLATLRIMLEIGLLKENAFLKHSWAFGSTFQVVIFSLGLADIINTLKKETLEKNKRLVIFQEQLVEMNHSLEEKVKERTIEIERALKEISNLLDNMSQAIFSIDSEGKIMAPVSNFARKIFFEDIEGHVPGCTAGLWR